MLTIFCLFVYFVQSWEERMKDAHDQGKLVLLQNLDPECTSGDIQVIAFDFLYNL